MERRHLLMLIEDDEFGLLRVPIKTGTPTASERLVASFNEVTEFVRRHGREPVRNQTSMTETQLAMRLQAVRDNEAQREVLVKFDELGLLAEAEPPASIAEAIATDDLGLLSDPAEGVFVSGQASRAPVMPGRIARRRPCEDFEAFAPLFEQCHAELRGGRRRLAEFRNPSQIYEGSFFVLSGVLLYVAEVGQKRLDSIRKANARLRCIFENGTESELLLQSLASNLYKDGKMVTAAGQEQLEPLDLEPGTPMASVYVLRSLSDDPQLRAWPALHKIGATRQPVAHRLASAESFATFLGAPVEVVAEYMVPLGVERKIESLLHRVFAPVRIDARLEMPGGKTTDAREWFAVPLRRIDEAISLIETGAITEYEYHPDSEAFALRAGDARRSEPR
jgi:T5orf172 domain